MVRCKYQCQSITKRAVYNDKSKALYEAEFTAVMDGSPENKEFFAYTPSGSLKVGQYKADLFEVGKSYYLDISPAE